MGIALSAVTKKQMAARRRAAAKKNVERQQQKENMILVGQKSHRPKGERTSQGQRGRSISSFTGLGKTAQTKTKVK